MAPGGSRPCRSPCRNPPSTDLVEDDFARDSGSVGGSHSGSTSPALSCNSTPGPNQVLALIPAPTPAPAPSPAPTNELFKKFIKAYLESNQRPRKPPEERKRTFKAKIPEVYYSKLYMDCYHFCQQCKDHFETTGATGFNRTPLATIFICGNINVRWTQFKRRNRGEELTPITWTKFKAFLQKNLGESKSFVNSLWRKLKRDSQYQRKEIYD